MKVENLKIFQCSEKGDDLHFLIFFGGGGLSKKGAVDQWVFSGGAEDFLNVIFNC